ncbi:bifunctional 2',3'-cyclic-nucleotide 2'-phosphodiesterase/3'-nucleotidase [Caldimonas tepidiphila]|uniref:bifunctional 2',3'-cyclic-nucleotide 2'-phosphodiesterase/3'-nucleotidase n=1 Tax=Caldimonas tepidiphila TaxID=2315841 RepID=UPI001F0C8BF5|nr:bifunctional 2',3'-cyclic-nucleotide 2'-phosphodiesterase/3'-nucleotidase [Caldimonas tepidiphila]
MIPDSRMRTLGAMALLAGLAACGSDDDRPAAAAAPAPAATALPAGATAQVTVLETTDLHANVLSYDYFKLAEDKAVGFERTATLLRQARSEFPNTVLIDNGDTIQGTALSDHQALVSPLACGQKLAIYKAMDAIGFDAGTIGNHEFNYGLPYLAQVTGSKFNVAGMPEPAAQPDCVGPKFPLALSNVTSLKDGKPLFKPYVIVTKKISAKDKDGKNFETNLKVAVLGFTPPAILSWDKRWLDGKVEVQGVVEAAAKYVPMARAEGADLVIAASHGGFDTRAYTPATENASFHLSKVPGIDGILMGHSHGEFPNPACNTSDCNAPGVDKVKGSLNGVPAVMPSFWGKAIGQISYSLVVKDGKWTIDTSKTAVSLRKTQDPVSKEYVAADAAIAPLVQAEHDAAVQYVKTPIGTSDFPMSTYFADVGDVTAIQVVNEAQADYVKKYIDANLPQYKGLPVLSVSAPFKSGFAGGSDFTDVAAGNIAINNAADLYLYPNTVYAVKVTGADIQAWLEKAASRYNRIDPTVTAEQKLVSTFPGYNFDVFTSPDLSYQIDVTQPQGSRIKALNYKGVAIDAAAEFVVATNNYRASGGGGFPGLDGSKTIWISPDANRDVLIDYIKARKTLSRAANGSARSWRFTQVATQGPVVFSSAPGKLQLALDAGIANVSQLRADDGSGKGLAVYAIDLSK